MLKMAKKIDFKARDYQAEIAEEASKSNIVACLGTGTGKTFISVMLVKELSHQVRIPFEQGGKRTFFLVPTVPLVHQQAAFFKDHTDLSVGTYYGSLKVDFWSKERWKEEFSKNQILFMTAEIFRAILEHGFISLSRVNLIIFDECHRAVKSHPYREIMRSFDLCKEHPKVLGLTASILNGKCKPGRLETRIKDLERTLRSKAVVPNNLTGEIRRYGTKPREILVRFTPYEINNASIIHVRDLFKHVLRSLPEPQKSPPQKEVPVDMDSDDSDNEELFNPSRDAKKYITDAADILNTLGPWCAREAISAFLSELQSALQRDIVDKDKLQSIYLVAQTFQQSVNLIDKALSGASNTNKALIGEMAPQKLLKLLEILRSKHPSFLKKEEDLCCVVFVEKRFVAYILNQWLIEVSKISNLNFLKSNFMVGHGSQLYATEIKAICMASTKQEQLLKDFRAKKFNVLVASSVIEEGMDVPHCNLVVRFDPPTDFRAYVQSKGRARAQNSVYILMTSNDDKRLALIEDLTNYNAIEKILQQYCQNRETPTEEDIDMHMADQLKEPYMPKKEDGGARVTMSSSISLLNRYCSNLIGDAFSHFAPRWRMKKVDVEGWDVPGYSCTIWLPMISPIREPIEGEVMKTKQHAKMAAALDACRILHQNGELNHNLLPIKFEVELDKDIEDQEAYRKALRIGASNQKEFYPKKVLSFKPVAAFEKCYIYVVQLKLIIPVEMSEEEKVSYFDPATTQYRFALISSSRISKVIPFAIYTVSGKVMVTLEDPIDTIFLKSDELSLIHKFHEYTIKDMLKVAKFPLRYNAQENHEWLLAPVILSNFNRLRTSVQLDWELMKKLENASTVEAETLPKFEISKYTDTIFFPKSQPDDLYYVVAVSKDMTSRSSFPKPEYKTYFDFYLAKEGVRVKNLDDPLLEAKHVSNPILNMPRYFDRKGIYSKQSASRLSRKLRFSPELVQLIPYPASLHKQALFMPCIISRINSLLFVEELRTTIVNEAGIGLSTFDWAPLDFKGFEIPSSVLPSRSKSNDLDAYNMQAAIQFDHQPDLCIHPGPSPSLLLEAVTSKHYADFLDFERLETVGDSFLKYAVSFHLFCKHPTENEGKLTVRKIRQISNYNLFKLGKLKDIPAIICYMIFQPSVNWRPPGFELPFGLEDSQVNTSISITPFWIQTIMPNIWDITADQIYGILSQVKKGKDAKAREQGIEPKPGKHSTSLDLLTLNCIGNKNVADCVEGLIGAYVVTTGPMGALHFLNWLGVEVFPDESKPEDLKRCFPIPAQFESNLSNKDDLKVQYLSGLDKLEDSINYKFKNKLYLLEALWHPSCDRRPITECYQRLEFLGDAVLDYIITRYLFENPRCYNPGELTDLRMSLVNNDFFAKLAIRYNVHKYLKHFSPNLLSAVNQFVKLLDDKEMDFLEEIELPGCDGAAEDLEVPKVLGDVIESIAGAIYLDSGLSMQTVWKVFHQMMAKDIEEFQKCIPKNPVRTLYELFPTRIEFRPPEETKSGKKIRVPLIVSSREKEYHFVGIAINKKTAKLTAAKIALKKLQKVVDSASLLLPLFPKLGL